MTAKVLKFYHKDAAKNPDSVLEQCIGNYDEVFVLGYDKTGNLDARASTNWDAKEILFALEVFKTKLLNGDYSSES